MAGVALAAAVWVGAAPAAGPVRSNGGTGFGAGPEAVGCASRAREVATRGPRSGRAVALSFDDGPSRTQTAAILGGLERLGARATFFEEGRHVVGREPLMREILATGSEIGNHSFHHPPYPGEAELAATDAAIRAATGFEPCLFRPPYGLVSPRLAAEARRNGLELVLWTLDSGDDHHPGVARIVSRVVGGAEPGSIVLLHDGGRHPQTVRALPAIVRGLRARGFRLVTVSELLGGRTLFRLSRG